MLFYKIYHGVTLTMLATHFPPSLCYTFTSPQLCLLSSFLALPAGADRRAQIVLLQHVTIPGVGARGARDYEVVMKEAGPKSSNRSATSGVVLRPWSETGQKVERAFLPIK